ncbi:MAG TPA: hypothetical protein VGZ33_07430 [Acidimicrobiales bacterium]|nr:hypothetical protein [Acidimicrobiales bacterium]
MSDSIQQFFSERVPSSWFSGELVLTTDDDEILCVGTLGAGAPSVEEFRESTREARMAIAAEAQPRFGRRVSWGVVRDGQRTLFTSQGTPVMTRLRIGERAVLDTLVRGGVARSRSDALAWCVKLVARHESEWLAELREALADVETVRRDGPTAL